MKQPFTDLLFLKGKTASATLTFLSINIHERGRQVNRSRKQVLYWPGVIP